MSTPKAHAPKLSLEQLHERDALHQAMLAATARLAQGHEPKAILRTICDALVSASPHIRLAWLYLGDPDAEVLRPRYAVGPARDYARALAIGRTPEESAGPTRRALATGRPVVARVRSDPSFAPWRERAVQAGLEACVILPFGGADGAVGLVAVYADQPDYYERAGLEPFAAFAQVGQVALEKARLLGRLEQLATFDSLTGLLNRHGLREILEREHARAMRRAHPFGLLLFDIDRFKLINDNFGHAVGDQVLAQIADIAKAALRDGDWIGRWGGEEFLCLLTESGEQEAVLVAERLRGLVEQTPIRINTQDLGITISVGVACFPADGESLMDLLKNADTALYEAKHSGRNRVIIRGGKSPGVFTIVGHLDQALRNHRVRPAFQPIVDLRSGRVVAEEALARIVGEDGTVLAAASFIKAASQLQLVHRIDHQIIRQTMMRCSHQAQAGTRVTHFVNTSADLLRHGDLVAELLACAQEQCAACGELFDREKPMVIEITEREFIGEAQEARRALAPFIDFGFRLAIDDFGSGYSSFQYLADLPVDYLKIEGGLVQRAVREPRVRAIIQGIQDVARELNLITLAEAVEDEATVEMLRDIGVDWAQGYFFGRPALE